MTAVPRVLTIQDMSSIGRCALTVMIPIISAMRCQAVPLATAVLSNHLEYPYYEFVDLSAHMRDFMDCWDKNEIDFHAIVSGFLASPEQIHLVEEAIDRFGNNGQMVIVDPAMADDGRQIGRYGGRYAPTCFQGPYCKAQLYRGLLLIRYSIFYGSY